MVQPPMPPQIAQQGAQQASPQDAMFANYTAGGGDQASTPDANQMGDASWQTLIQKVDQFEKLTGEIFNMLQTLHKPATALMAPIAQAGQALKKELNSARQEIQKSKSPAPTDSPVDSGATPPPPDKSNNPVEMGMAA